MDHQNDEQQSSSSHHSGGDPNSLYVANEMSLMSIQERNEILHDIHGVPEIIDETPQFIKETLDAYDAEMQSQLSQQTNNNNHEAYSIVKRIDPLYVQSNEFRLAFLRACQFKPREAAKRVIEFFHQKQKLFPNNIVALAKREITMNDLSASEVDIIKSGYFQCTRNRDQAGRLVIFMCNQRRQFISTKSMIRAVWYFLMVIAKDALNQKSGVVFVVYSLGIQYTVADRDIDMKLSRLSFSIPLRACGIHYCFDNLESSADSHASMAACSKENRLRQRIHYGTHVAVQGELQRYGIPSTIIPIDVNGIVSLEDHQNWVETRIRIENSKELGAGVLIGGVGGQQQGGKDSWAGTGQQQQSGVNFGSAAAASSSSISSSNDGINDGPTIIETPGYYDILNGRGNYIKDHPGNCRFVDIIEMHRDEYERSSRTEKGQIIENIARIVHSTGGRFLKRTNPDGGDDNSSDFDDVASSSNYAAVRPPFLDPSETGTNHTAGYNESGFFGVLLGGGGDLSHDRQQNQQRQQNIAAGGGTGYWIPVADKHFVRQKIHQAFRVKRAGAQRAADDERKKKSPKTTSISPSIDTKIQPSSSSSWRDASTSSSNRRRDYENSDHTMTTKKEGKQNSYGSSASFSSSSNNSTSFAEMKEGNNREEL